MGIAAGSLNRQVTIERRVAGEDAAGQPVESWEPVATVYANIAGQTGLGAARDMQGDIATSIARYSIRIRYREGLDSGMRVVASGQVFDVKQVRMDFAGRVWTDLVCELSDG